MPGKSRRSDTDAEAFAAILTELREFRSSLSDVRDDFGDATMTDLNERLRLMEERLMKRCDRLTETIQAIAERVAYLEGTLAGVTNGSIVRTLQRNAQRSRLD